MLFPGDTEYSAYGCTLTLVITSIKEVESPTKASKEKKKDAAPVKTFGPENLFDDFEIKTMI